MKCLDTDRYFYWVILPLIFTLYFSSFEAGWHFDDLQRITLNPKLHLTSFSTDSLLDTFYSIEESPTQIYRPVACLTLALNWYLHEDNILGYHIVNLVIHLLTTFCLLKTFLLLYQTPALQKTSRRTLCQVSLLATTLWAIHPIHTQAVTYIVQRMCLMAALFYVLGIFLYLQLRLSKQRSKKKKLIPLIALCYLLALGSKENASIFPTSLFLIEIIFFYSATTWRKNYAPILITISFFIATAFTFLYLSNYSQQIQLFQGYPNRFFTIQERLLTESRIILHYISQLFYPIPQRLSLAHDIQLSQSLFNPFSTFYSVFTLLALVLIAIKTLPRWPIFSFAVLFFISNHLIESTILPLELIFEHRNYLPSMFLFWPLAHLFCSTIPSRYIAPRINQFIWKPAIISLIFLISMGTISRNRTWHNEQTLWSDAHNKAPGRARPIYYLGKVAENKGDLHEALAFYKKAVLLTAPSPSIFRSLTYSEIAEFQFQLKQYNDAIVSYQKILELHPDSPFALYKQAETYFAMGYPQKAEHLLRLLIREHKSGVKTHALLGKILLLTGKPTQALNELARSLQYEHLHDTAINFSIALTVLKQYKKANDVLNELYFPKKNDLLAIELLSMINLEETEHTSPDKKLTALLADYPAMEIKKDIQKLSQYGIPANQINNLLTNLQLSAKKIL